MTALDDRPVEQTTAVLMLEHDRGRARSLQRELGWSDVGVCRKRAGYWLAGVEPTDPGGSLPAVLGSVIHEGAAKARAAARPHALIEYEVRYAGILGHLDWYEDGELGDLKTTSQRNLDRYEANGPDINQVWQINGYAAGLIRAGFPVRRIVLDFLARDTGNTWQWTGRPDPAQVRDALAWVNGVRSVPLEMLGRDYAPTSEWCKGCLFRTACWDGGIPGRDPRSVIYAENPDARMWAEELRVAQQAQSDAKKRVDQAKGVLDALRPNTRGKSDVVDVGMPDVGLRWTVSPTGQLDSRQVRADYAEAGLEPPMSDGTRTTLSFAALPKPGDAS